MVELEHAAEALSAYDIARATRVIGVRLDELTTNTLVMAFSVVVRGQLPKRVT